MSETPEIRCEHGRRRGLCFDCSPYVPTAPEPEPRTPEPRDMLRNPDFEDSALGQAMDAGDYARVMGDAADSNPYTTPAMRAAWEKGYRAEPREPVEGIGYVAEKSVRPPLTIGEDPGQSLTAREPVGPDDPGYTMQTVERFAAKHRAESVGEREPDERCGVCGLKQANCTCPAFYVTSVPNAPRPPSDAALREAFMAGYEAGVSAEAGHGTRIPAEACTRWLSTLSSTAPVPGGAGDGMTGNETDDGKPVHTDVGRSRPGRTRRAVQERIANKVLEACHRYAARGTGPQSHDWMAAMNIAAEIMAAVRAPATEGERAE